MAKTIFWVGISLILLGSVALVHADAGTPATGAGGLMICVGILAGIAGPVLYYSFDRHRSGR